MIHVRQTPSTRSSSHDKSQLRWHNVTGASRRGTWGVPRMSTTEKKGFRDSLFGKEKGVNMKGVLSLKGSLTALGSKILTLLIFPHSGGYPESLESLNWENPADPNHQYFPKASWYNWGALLRYKWEAHRENLLENVSFLRAQERKQCNTDCRCIAVLVEKQGWVGRSWQVLSKHAFWDSIANRKLSVTVMILRGWYRAQKPLNPGNTRKLRKNAKSCTPAWPPKIRKKMPKKENGQKITIFVFYSVFFF